MTSFAVLPPELNSARIYAGPGSESMLGAAAAWDELTAELDAASSSFASVITRLAGGPWLGPASEAMLTVATPYGQWLAAAVAQAAQTATQARAAAGAFEAAQTTSVHPALVATNRAVRTWLARSNLFGQNAPAIAATEDAYEQMWAQDVAAMAGYHSAARTVAAQLTTWQPLVQKLAERLQSACAAALGPAATGQLAAPIAASTSLIMGGSGTPQPDPAFVASVDALYIAPNYPGYAPLSLYTPEQWLPLTSISLQPPYFTTSVGDGLKYLHAAVMAQYAAANKTVVFGYSQSAGISTLEMRYLESLPIGQKPDINQLSFALVGNPNRPDGGLYVRFDNPLSPLLQAWGIGVAGATPTNAYPTVDYAIQYDGIADFPQYPINVFADANAVAGMLFRHPLYSNLTPAQVALGVTQPVSPADTLTSYVLIPSHDLPLLDPLRAIPLLGNPLADLVQPDLRILVELGYDRTAYQDVPTPIGLFPQVDLPTVAAELQQGLAQGLSDALSEI